MSDAVELTDTTFDEKVKTNKNVVVDLWAPWCGPCRMMTPVIDELAGKYKGTVFFGKLNTDENQTIPAKFGIMGIPTLLFFREGKLVDKVVGALAKPSLEENLIKAFNVKK